MSLTTRVIFGEVDIRYLAVPTYYKMHPVHTIVLNFEDSLILMHLQLGGIRLHVPYLLLVHICKFFVNCFSPFFARIFVGMIPSLLSVWSTSGVGLVLLVTMARLIKKFKFLMAFFSCIACLTILLALSLYQAWSFSLLAPLWH